MDDDCCFDDAVPRIVDHHVAETELRSVLGFFLQLGGLVQPVGVSGECAVDVLVDIPRELDGFSKPMDTLDDSTDELCGEVSGIG